MRIISPYRDFYDNAMAFGQDDTVVYTRKPEVFHGSVPGITFPWEGDNREVLRIGINRKGFSQSLGELLGCYLFIAGVPRLVFCQPNMGAGLRSYPLEDARVFRGSVNPNDWRAVVYERAYQCPLEDIGLNTGWRYDEFLATYQKFLDRRDLDKVHFTANAPVVLAAPASIYEHRYSRPGERVQETVLISNMPLVSFHVEKTMHAFDAFQAISQYIEGVLPRSTAPTVELSDKEQVRKKGFDPEYGFRQPPGKIKRRKHRKEDEQKGDGQAQE